eukprot:1047839-Pyramimonas_sp.AAC.1
MSATNALITIMIHGLRLYKRLVLDTVLCQIDQWMQLRGGPNMNESDSDANFACTDGKQLEFSRSAVTTTAMMRLIWVV